MDRGSEPPAEEAVRLIRDTGGVSVLAHPWALKNPVPIITSLSEAGLHGVEVYRSDGKLTGKNVITSHFSSNPKKRINCMSIIDQAYENTKLCLLLFFS